VCEAASSQPLEAVLAAARARIQRLSPVETLAAVQAGAILVDTRSSDDRERHGIVPGSLHIPRTVLEWRIAPDSTWRNPHVGSVESELIVLCDHGYSSILAAAMLVDLGFTRAGDVVGGFEAWRAAGLAVASAPTDRRRPGELAGMRGPDAL
jgi:rhodanese-related sulfurtransferase